MSGGIQQVGEVERATPGSRLLASLIDVVLQLVVLPVPFLGILASVVYGLVKDALPFLDGQSIGKRAMGIRAVREQDGSKLTNDYGTAIVRQISLYIPFFNIVDAVMVLSADRKRFGDRWAKTIVIRD
jgi:uncharacterized RDD family membrane protein YckC